MADPVLKPWEKRAATATKKPWEKYSAAAPATTEAPQYAPNGVPMNAAAKAEIAAKAKAGTLSVSPASAAGSEAMTAKAEDATGRPWYDPILRTAGDLTLAGVTGLGQGAMETAGMGGTGAGLAESGARWVGGLLGQDWSQVPEGALRSALPLGDLPSGAELRGAASDLTGGLSEYNPETWAGDVLQTGAQFIGGGMKPMPGLIAGLGAEGAGKLTEGGALEPYARVAGGIVGALLGGGIKPGLFAGGVDDEAARMANVTSEAGVRGVTKGQATGSEALMRLEGRLQATDTQLKDFTAATLGKLGSDAKVATPSNLLEIEKRLVTQMDDAVKGVDIVPTNSNAAAAARVASDYLDRVPAGMLTPRIKGIAKEIAALAKSGKTVALEKLKTWRQDIGSLTVSADDATREAAHNLRTLLDDMTDTALQAAGRADDIASLAAARTSYRDYIGVRDAASRAGAEGGILSPQALNQSVIRAQGRTAYATGRTTPMADFTRSAAATLRSAPAVSAGGVRSIGQALPAALATAGATAGYGAGLGPFGMGIAGLLGATAPALGQAAMRSGPVQAVLRNPMDALGQASRVMPGLLAQ